MHNKLFILSLLTACLFATTSCSKEASVPSTASLTIINAVAGSNALVLNFSASPLEWYQIAPKLFYNKFFNQHQINSYSGKQNLSIYQYPDTLPGKSFLQVPLDLTEGSVSTLFVTGTTTTPDILLTTDYPPPHAITDSVTGIRFVNLSAGSAPVSINIQGQPNGSEITSLPYKSITGFHNYAATYDKSSITFECRDVSTGTLLASYTAEGLNNTVTNEGIVNTWRYRNFTLALMGLPDGTGVTKQTFLLINNF